MRRRWSRIRARPRAAWSIPDLRLGALARYGEALDVFAKGLPDLPDLRAHGYYAFLLLTLGRLREGWAQYEFRWMQEPHLSNRPGFSQPQWAGQDLRGKTLLMIDEQGAGDIIHFARFAKPLKAMGATVLLMVRPDMAHACGGICRRGQSLCPSVGAAGIRLPHSFDEHSARARNRARRTFPRTFLT